MRKLLVVYCGISGEPDSNRLFITAWADRIFAPADQTQFETCLKAACDKTMHQFIDRYLVLETRDAGIGGLTALGLQDVNADDRGIAVILKPDASKPEFRYVRGFEINPNAKSVRILTAFIEDCLPDRTDPKFPMWEWLDAMEVG